MEGLFCCFKSYNWLMFQNKNFFVIYKLSFGLLGFSAIVTEIVVLMERGVFNLANFLSYFTIESNTLVVVTLLLSAVAVRGKSNKLDILRGAVTVYILIVGIGFSLLLAGIEGLVLTAVPWDNTVLHYIIPVAVLIDYLIDRPKRKLPFGKSLIWLLFPVIYVAYSLTRGALTGWYPYPFLNPDTKGYGAVAFTVTSLLLLGVVLTWLATRVPDRTGKK
ncbi:conserved hypothetical protein [candidate division TM7 genomosp. GTL1]|nr:conserved hypothetical protein [candidate division TM7 genomosp. GTL1]